MNLFLGEQMFAWLKLNLKNVNNCIYLIAFLINIKELVHGKVSVLRVQPT